MDGETQVQIDTDVVSAQSLVSESIAPVDVTQVEEPVHDPRLEAISEAGADTAHVEESEGELQMPDPLQDTSASTERSTRQKTMSKAGKEYNIEVRSKALTAAVKKWRKLVDTTEDMLVDCDNVTDLTARRDRLQLLIDEVETAMDHLSKITFVDLPWDRMEGETRDCKRQINRKIQSIKARSKAPSSRGSGHSSQSLKLRALAKAAEAKTQLKFSEAAEQLEAKQFHLEQMKKKMLLKRDLEVAEATVQAFKEDEQIIDLEEELLPEDDADPTERVREYIESLSDVPLNVTQADVHVPETVADSPVSTAITTAHLHQPIDTSRVQFARTAGDNEHSTVLQVSSAATTSTGLLTSQPRTTQPRTTVGRPPIMSTWTSARVDQQSVRHPLNPQVPPYVPRSSQQQVTTLPREPFASEDANRRILDMTDFMMSARINPPEPPIFNGDPLEYPGWKSAFEALVENKYIPESDKIHYLKRYLGGEARQCIDGHFLFSTNESFIDAKRVLEQRFGDPFVLEDAFRSKLAKWPKVQAKDGKAMRRFADFLQQCLAATKVLPNLTVLSDVRENQKLQEKLPDWALRRWARIVAQCKQSYRTFPSFEDFVKFVIEESEIACNPAIISQSVKEVKTDTKSKPQKKINQVLATETKSDNTNQVTDNNATGKATERKLKPCYLCKGTHNLDNCPQFLRKTIEDRLKYVAEERLCYACLGIKHQAKKCKYRKKCKTCHKRHPTSLHKEKGPDESNEPAGSTQDISPADVKQPEVHGSTLASHAHVSLYAGMTETTRTSMILPVYVSSSTQPNHEELTYAILDPQSNTTFILDDTCKRLGAQGQNTTLKLSTMSAKDQLINTKKVCNLRVRGFTRDEYIELPPAYTSPSIPMNRAQIPTQDTASNWPHLQQLARELPPLQDVDIGLLIGDNCLAALSPQDFIPAPKSGGPYAQKSVLGWGIIGGASNREDNEAAVCYRVLANNPDGSSMIVPHVSSKEMVHSEVMAGSWESSFEVKLDTKLSIQDRKFLDILHSELQINDEDHYVMPLPFKEKEPILPNNRILAEKRLIGLKNKMMKNEEYREEYVNFMEDIIQKGYAEKCLKEPEQGRVWYIPHHGVFHPKKKKIRVVFDCASEYQGISLNNILLQGPDLTNSLLGVLCRFRQERVAISCDIQKMFYQFYVAENHQDYIRFLWWPKGDTSQPACDYRMTVHLFGAVSSPACANFGLKKVADDGEDQFGSQAAEFIRNSFYVDDGLTSVATEEEAIYLVLQTKQLCAFRGIRLHKFASNSKHVMESIPEEDRVESLQNLDLPDSSVTIERALGIEWNIELDQFCFKIRLKDRPLTKRGILSSVGSLFDPLGFLSPVTLSGKTILQDACRMKLDWDDPLPDSIVQRWLKWRSKLFHLESVHIDRCIKPKMFGRIVKREIHHFSDASNTGIGQCSYIRLIDEKGQVHCSFLMGKARVAPLKIITVPRLELNAAVLSVRQSRILKEELNWTNDVEETFWCDSRVVLGYISNEARRFHVFVANRVQEIRDHTNPNQWKYIGTKDNPADHGSRGLAPTDTRKIAVWLNGPQFLWKAVLPSDDEVPVIQESDPELKRCLAVSIVPKFDLESRLSRFSDWKKAKRAVANCIRYLHILKSRVDGSSHDITKPTVEQLKKAESVIIRAVQHVAFPEQLAILERRSDKDRLKRKDPLNKFDPIIDNDGVMRVGGRIKDSQFPMEEIHPTILPKNSHITYLIVQECHKKMEHQGRSLTINCIRSSGYYVMSCSSLVRSYIAKCVVCRKWRSKAQVQKMANLPKDRMELSAPFTYCAVDYFGPFYIRVKRSDVPKYGVLFTCLLSRAIHLEVASSLDTDAFLNALRRFIAIRGPIRVLRSDRGTNFIGAANELQQAQDAMKDDRVRQFLLDHGADIEFKTNFPSSSHMGGVWERLIRSVRNVLVPLLSRCGSQLDDESLRTLFYEVMSIVNSRPLTTDSLSDDSLSPLTPNHLLTAKSSIVLPPPAEFQEADIYSRKRWRRVQYMLNVFWSRWRSEYLQSLQSRPKWNDPVRNMQIGDVVIVKDENVARNHWQLAIVEDTCPSNDNRVRKVKLRLSDSSLDNKGKRVKKVSYLERPIHKLILLVESPICDREDPRQGAS